MWYFRQEVKMESKTARQMIECYHHLLVKNMILTDDFYRTLTTHGVFTENLLRDVKV